MFGESIGNSQMYAWNNDRLCIGLNVMDKAGGQCTVSGGVRQTAGSTVEFRGVLLTGCDSHRPIMIRTIPISIRAVSSPHGKYMLAHTRPRGGLKLTPVKWARGGGQKLIEWNTICDWRELAMSAVGKSIAGSMQKLIVRLSHSLTL